MRLRSIGQTCNRGLSTGQTSHVFKSSSVTYSWSCSNILHLFTHHPWVNWNKYIRFRVVIWLRSHAEYLSVVSHGLLTIILYRISDFRTYYRGTCLNRISLGPAFVSRIDRLNKQRLGLYLKFSLCRIPIYSGFG